MALDLANFTVEPNVSTEVERVQERAACFMMYKIGKSDSVCM